MNNVCEFKRKQEKIPVNINWEVYLLSNSSEYKIDIYNCFRGTSIDGYESYVFKRRKDDKLICEFSPELEYIVPIQIPVSATDFEIAMNRLKDEIEKYRWIDERCRWVDERC